jgi:hypothetical protein
MDLQYIIDNIAERDCTNSRKNKQVDSMGKIDVIAYKYVIIQSTNQRRNPWQDNVIHNVIPFCRISYVHNWNTMLNRCR